LKEIFHSIAFKTIQENVNADFLSIWTSYCPFHQEVQLWHY